MKLIGIVHLTSLPINIIYTHIWGEIKIMTAGERDYGGWTIEMSRSFHTWGLHVHSRPMLGCDRKVVSLKPAHCGPSR